MLTQLTAFPSNAIPADSCCTTPAAKDLIHALNDTEFLEALTRQQSIGDSCGDCERSSNAGKAQVGQRLEIGQPHRGNHDCRCQNHVRARARCQFRSQQLKQVVPLRAQPAN